MAEFSFALSLCNFLHASPCPYKAGTAPPHQVGWWLQVSLLPRLTPPTICPCMLFVLPKGGCVCSGSVAQPNSFAFCTGGSASPTMFVVEVVDGYSFGCSSNTTAGGRPNGGCWKVFVSGCGSGNRNATTHQVSPVCGTCLQTPSTVGQQQ